MYLRASLCNTLLAIVAIHEGLALFTSQQFDYTASPLLQRSKACDSHDYNSDDAISFSQYICHNGVLCPVINGEPLALCGRACYSKYVYTCHDGTDLLLRPPLHRGRITLRAENPQDVSSPPTSPYPIPGGGPGPAAVIGVDGQLMTACRLVWNVGGITCSYCPVPQVDPTRCPEGNVTALSAVTNAMDVVVPGGQQFFLTESWTVGYTQAHSMLMPNGSTVAGFRAFEGGGFFNILDGAWGWAACGQGEQRELHVRNSTNANELRGCVGLNLNILPFEDDAGAWQYS